MQDQRLLSARLILEELKLSTADYFDLLSPKEQLDFLSGWNDLQRKSASKKITVLQEEVHGLIARFPALQEQFMGEKNPADADRFNPNLVSSQPPSTSSIEIRNEIINVIQTITLQLPSVAKQPGKK